MLDILREGRNVAKSLVIVESPAKAKTISRFLGRNYTVKASVGHVRDLPKSQFGVDIDNGFQPKYITIRGKGPILKELRDAAKKSDSVLFATDPDREGEAISWHLAEALQVTGDGACRVEFHEITEQAVKKAIKEPRPINQDLVNAQQARRILDRVVGYKLSPLLWAKVKKGLSAGRVQSVAVRLICDREAEIDAFQPEEYWSIVADLQSAGESDPKKGVFTAKLHQVGGKKAEIKNQQAAEAIVKSAAQAEFAVQSVERRERRRNPAAPFTTSSLQQEASRKLGFTARRTMRVAQQLYEGLDVGSEGTVGLVTYIRTDATRVAPEAQAAARKTIEELYGKEYLPSKPPVYKMRAGAQAAHEAIRPTSMQRRPEDVKQFLTRDQQRLYRLIWERFIASQMAPAIYDTVTVNVKAGHYLFRASGRTVKFPGFMALYIENTDDGENTNGEDGTLPELTKDEILRLLELTPNQHFTQPPPRYSEAMLVKTLEELGIGRPSTYAQIIDTIRRRGYVVIEEKRFWPTELGCIVVELLKEHFPNIIDVEFTANMEGRLDQIEEGQEDWVQVLTEFWGPFEVELKRAELHMEEVEIAEEETDEVCEKCGRNMVIRQGRYGQFLACPGFPECRNTKPLLKEIGVVCPQCGGQVVERTTRRGRTFYGCANYPKCEFTSWQRPVGKDCPQCGQFMVLKARRNQDPQAVCSNKECGYQVELVEEA
ncbi:MAG: type I DNA topoisomerase [Firmicutes bacterium]|nr:type I DNA topoisomerase [Bacillota bacterium]